MPWVEFKKDFDWKPLPSVTTAYMQGGKYLVTTPCYQAAKKAGVVFDITAPRKEYGSVKGTRPKRPEREIQKIPGDCQGGDQEGA